MTGNRFFTAAFLLAASLGVTSPAPAQGPLHRVGITTPLVSSEALPQLASRHGTPRWLKWGIAGAVAGGILFAVAGQSNPERGRSVAADAALGAVIGFSVIGGGIALYDWVCAPDSRSRRTGLCGR